MTISAIQDVISIVGSAYLQPIVDLLDKLLEEPISRAGPGGTGLHENGYSAAIIVLLVFVLESYTARVRFVRREEKLGDGTSTPDLLANYFPRLSTKEDLVEVFILRNALVHNHLWHQDISAFAESGASTLATPLELGNTNKHYKQVVDIPTRRTLRLQLNVIPTAVDRRDVQTVFSVIWSTLEFMNAANYSHTPLAGTIVRFRGNRRELKDVFGEISV
jgi:hypothetical protein